MNRLATEIGETPLVRLLTYPKRWDTKLWAKLELHNPGGSSKDRSAYRMVKDALDRGEIQAGDTVVESTSGNLGVGLALACRAFELDLICVVDTRTGAPKIRKMRELGAEVRVVSRPDPRTGDLLAARLHAVKEIVDEVPGAWWPDQYSNPSNPAAHWNTMAEIDSHLNGDLDYLFVATSTTGTLRGCCDYIVQAGLKTRVVAVDATGSVLFGGKRGPRRLPGFGAGVRTKLSEGAWFDRLVRVEEIDCVRGCRRLQRCEGVFAGASSGGVASAYDLLEPSIESGATCAMIFADGGESYLDSVYSDAWVRSELGVAPDALDGWARRKPGQPARG